MARVLRLEKILFMPKQVERVPKGNYTLYTNPQTGKVYGKSNRPSQGRPGLVYTRNFDDTCFDFTGLERKIKTMQYLLHLLTDVELTPHAAKALRRVSIIFGSMYCPSYRKVMKGLICYARGRREVLEIEVRNPTFGNRLKPLRVRSSQRQQRFTVVRGVVRHPLYGDIPTFRKERQLVPP